MDGTQEHQPGADAQGLLDQLFVKINALNTVGDGVAEDIVGDGNVVKGFQSIAETPEEAVSDLWDAFQQSFPLLGGTVHWRQMPSLMHIDGQYVAKMRLVVVYGDG